MSAFYILAEVYIFYNLAVLDFLAMENDAVCQPPMPAKRRRRLQDDPALCWTTNARGQVLLV